MARTSKDEYELDQSLRAEEEVKREVIVELRDYSRHLLENQERTVTALIETADLLQQSLDALRVYRVEVLQATKNALANPSQCKPGCNRHQWDSTSGWKKAGINEHAD